MMNMRLRALLFTLVAGLAFAGPVGAVDTTLSNARLLTLLALTQCFSCRPVLGFFRHA